VNRPAYTTSRAVLAIAAVALVLVPAGCGSTSSPASKTHAPSPAPTKLTGTVSVTGRVTLETSGGQPVTRLPSGWYSVLVRVNSTHEDFHLIGPSVDRTTTGNTPSLTLWGIQFIKGTYRYMNDRDTRAAARVFSVY
jgi:hypothetical protein